MASVEIGVRHPSSGWVEGTPEKFSGPRQNGGVSTSARHAEWIANWLGPGDLAPLGPDDITELVALLREDHYATGDTVYKLGQAPTRVLIVRSGSIELSRTLNGRRATIQILRPGEVLGDISLFLRIAVPWDATAREESLILSIDSVSLHRLLEQRPRLLWRWLHSTSSRVAGFWFRVVELLAGGLEAQIAILLVRQAEDGVVHLSQASLAELVGHTRTSVNRVLKRLEHQGRVALRYGEVEILDEHGLKAIAGLE